MKKIKFMYEGPLMYSKTNLVLPWDAPDKKTYFYYSYAKKIYLFM